MNPLKQFKCPIVIDDDYMWADDDFSLLEENDFDYPLDDRAWKSNIEDIEGGDNFFDFCKELFKILDEEDYWEN